VLLALAAGAALSRYVGATVGEAEFLRWTIDASQRLAWLEDYAARQAEHARRRARRARDGIRFERVSFRYPGTDARARGRRPRPAGRVGRRARRRERRRQDDAREAALPLYEPTRAHHRRRRRPRAHAARRVARAARRRVPGLLPLRVRGAARVGVGDVPRLDDAPAVERRSSAPAPRRVDALPAGLDTQLGPTWRDGVELSFGQWQKLALARGFMRERRSSACSTSRPRRSTPRPSTRSSSASRAGARRAGADGRITVLVSHRFSTVRMADLIVVLDGARVVEVGSHAALVARGGLYAELYETQARAYR
jgi:ATP-binding cassette subfamily B protein